MDKMPTPEECGLIPLEKMQPVELSIEKSRRHQITINLQFIEPVSVGTAEQIVNDVFGDFSFDPSKYEHAKSEPK